MWRFAFLGLAFLGLTVSCTDGPAAPSENVDGLSLQLGDPPPPPVDGDVLFLPSFSIAVSTSASAGQQDCPVQFGFCVPARYFHSGNLSENTEWLDYLPEDPLPNDIKRQLKEDGAACGFDLTGNDVMCDVTTTVQGRLEVKNMIGDGKGLAYDVQPDGSVITIALDQFDDLPDPLHCSPIFEGVVVCDTDIVLSEIWRQMEDGTYMRDPEPVPGAFSFSNYTDF